MIACVPRSLASSHRQDLAPLQSQADVVLAAPSLELTVDLSVPRKGMQLRSFREQAMLMIVLAEKVFPSTVSYVMKLRHRRLWTVYRRDVTHLAVGQGGSCLLGQSLGARPYSHVHREGGQSLGACPDSHL